MQQIPGIKAIQNITIEAIWFLAIVGITHNFRGCRSMNLKAVGIIVLFTFSCFSQPLIIPEDKNKKPSSNFMIYPAYAKKCGLLLLMFILIGINDRFVNAYSKIVKQAKGGILSRITLQKSWHYGFIGTGYYRYGQQRG
ncbi:hypothetical protein DPV73_16845 [Leptospira mayottensis]|nr:hypothetical protein DPV73_16845 [Leptospira mayottensis]